MVFCNTDTKTKHSHHAKVTILILIDGFLQYIQYAFMYVETNSHNPYFNRWFSAIANEEYVWKSEYESQSLF